MIKRLLKLFHKRSKAGVVQTPVTSAGVAAAHPVSAAPPRDDRSKGKSHKTPVQHSGRNDGGTNKAAKFRQPRPARSKKQPDKWDIKQFEVDPKEGENRFHDFDLPDKIMHAIADLGFKYCTPIQAQTLSHTMAGADAIGQAQTGTGKTAAFLITIIKNLLAQNEDKQRHGCPRSLIIAPTRELVMQIAEDGKHLAKYCPLNVCAVFGGMDYEKQQRAMEQHPVDILVATPGRLIDFQRRRIVDLQRVRMMVIDEADRMLDMGFIPDVRRIVNSTPPREKRQTLMFSATMTPEVKRLASQWCKKPIYVKIESEDMTASTVEQIVYLATAEEKYAILYNIITHRKLKKVLVFTNRKDETRTLCQRLLRNNVNCDMLSGDVAQKKRLTILNKFKDGRIEVLVATDVAGRGIHVDGISHVFNYVLPYEAEDYVHRIGRTGRAGHTGVAISFADEEAAFYLPAIEKLIDHKLECIYPDDALVRPAPRGAMPKNVGGKSDKKYHGQRRPSTGRRPSSRGHYRARPAGSAVKNKKAV